MIEYQYFNQIKKGDTVKLWCGDYRVQNDRGNLHVVATIDGHRKKITLKEEMFFIPGSKADWAINGWWQLYADYETYRSFAEAELAWLKK
jgi:hypothetical protein